MKKAPEIAAPGVELQEGRAGVSIRVRVTPRSSQDSCDGVRDGALLMRLEAPPVEGAANEALTRFLARALGIAPSSVTVSKGPQSRQKVVTIAGLTVDAVRARLGGKGSLPDRGRP